MIRAILFDCFGVLVGTGFENTYRTAGGDPERDKVFIKDVLERENRGSITTSEFHQAFTKKLAITPAAWQQAIDEAEQPNMDLLRYIQKLHGTYKTAVLSNSNAGVVKTKIGSEQLKICFDKVIISAEIGMIKPEPAIYRYAAELLGVSPDACVFIDDREMHLRPARALGMGAILYRDFQSMKRELEKLLAADPES